MLRKVNQKRIKTYHILDWYKLPHGYKLQYQKVQDALHVQQMDLSHHQSTDTKSAETQ